MVGVLRVSAPSQGAESLFVYSNKKGRKNAAPVIPLILRYSGGTKGKHDTARRLRRHRAMLGDLVNQLANPLCSSPSGYHSVIPAKAGIQYFGMDSGSPFHSARNDGEDLA